MERWELIELLFPERARAAREALRLSERLAWRAAHAPVISSDPWVEPPELPTKGAGTSVTTTGPADEVITNLVTVTYSPAVIKSPAEPDVKPFRARGGRNPAREQGGYAMAICAVCSAPCRGKCARCGALLCARHRPASARAKCAVCKQLRTGAAQAVQAIPPYPAPVRQLVPSSAPASSMAPLAALSLADQLAWIADRRAKLRQKQDRERAYLDRRAARGTHTPTDDAYEADALLENDLFEALDLLEAYLQGGTPTPGPTSSGHTYDGDTSMLFPDPGLHSKLQP
jgi:hypothetical protein